MKVPPRRIALVQAGLGAGGAEKTLCLLATHFDSQGDAITMLAISGRSGDSYYKVPAGVTVRTMEEELGQEAPQSTFRRIVWLRKALRELDTDLVISFLTKINVQVAIAAIGLDVARIASERNNFRVQPMNPVWRLLMPATVASADVAVMLTEAARSALPAWARNRAVVIYCPATEGLEQATESPPPRRLVATGRLTKQKGFDVLIRAVHRGRQQGCNLSLTIYGEGEDREFLSNLAQSLGLSGQVRFAGRTSRPHDWTRGGGIFVLSSRYEGFGNVLIEAMAAGFAVVSTACDWGPPEVVRHGRDGVLVPPDDPEELANALVRVWEDDALRARLAEAAVVRAADFSQTRILSEWDAAVAKALDGPRGQQTSERRRRSGWDAT